MEVFHGTTIVSARRGSKVAMGGDGQVTLGNIIVKQGAKKVRRLHHDRILAGFAGGLPMRSLCSSGSTPSSTSIKAT